MMDTSPDQIRDIAVKVVEDFINSKIPLSQGIAAVSKDLGLNSEQIKRVVEASNSIAYLKLLEGSEDRTFEFPVAKYEDVIGSIALPDPMSKVASYHVPVLTKESFEMPELTKSSFELSSHEKYQALLTEMIQNKAQLEKLAYDLQEVGMLIEKSAMLLRKEPECLEKLASVADEACYSRMSRLMFGQVKEASDNAAFMNSELAEARNLVDLVKQAEAMINEKLYREELHTKMAGIVGSIGRGVGNVIGGVLNTAASGVGRAAGGIVGTAAGAAGKIIGSKAVRKGAAAAALPILGGIGITAHSGPNVWDALHS
jgi:hypothetical protein